MTKVQIKNWEPGNGSFERFYVKGEDGTDFGFIQVDHREVRRANPSKGRYDYDGFQDLGKVQGDEAILRAVIALAEKKGTAIGNALGLLSCNTEILGEKKAARQARRVAFLEV